MTKLVRILIIDDSESDADLIRYELDRGGIEHFNQRVSSESEFAAALKGREWDVVLSGYTVPGFGALKALDMLRSREIDLPFILVSGTLGEDAAVEAVKAGAHDYLIKGNLSRLIPIIYREMREHEIRASNRKIQSVIRKSEDRLRISQKMEAVGRLAGGIAHNFNNLLTVMNGYNEMALTGLDQTHPLRADLEQVKNSLAKATLLTKQLLDFSRGKALSPQPMDLNAASRQTFQMLTPMIRDDIEFTLVTEAEHVWIHADLAQIQQIAMNLVLNSRDAMPNGGKLQIRTGNAHLNEPFPNFASRFKPGRYVSFTVEDSGFGIGEKTMEHLFEPFFTTKEFGKGTGLGLATVYGIVNHCGGQIQVSSQPGQGAAFSVFFPSLERANGAHSPGAQAHPAKAKTGIVAIPRGEESILLVENDESVRTLLLQVLRRNGFQVLAAANGEEALKLSGECERIHLLLTDVVMPGMSGLELAGRLSQRHPESKILFMSGYNVNNLDTGKFPNLALDVLEKPFSPERLLKKIQSTLMPATETGPGER